MLRTIEPELLDQLPADDIRAIRHRRDLKVINAVILQSGIMAKAITEQWTRSSPRTLLDLGSGDGTFMLSVARRLAACWGGVTVTLLDQRDIVSNNTREAFATLGWKAQTITADVFEYLRGLKPSSADIVTANLFLHHFNQHELSELLARVAPSSQVFVACEPRRTKFALRSSQLLWMIGCSDIAVHDAVVSVRAGFKGSELSELWPKEASWELHEFSARLFTHCLAAHRR
jgi:2-polyprenyl-3-methyl-5-hydroxy-6-metoxy-1,4-benzoquinol methylase